MSLKDFINEQLDPLRPDDDDDDLEEQLNAAMPKFGNGTVFVYVNEAQTEIEAVIKMDGMIPMDLVNNVAGRIAKIVPVSLVGMSGGSTFEVAFHFEIVR